MALDPTKKYKTSSGHDVVIYCWDAPDEEFPVHGRVEGHRTPICWTAYGSYLGGECEPHELDLIEVPQPRVVWRNEYPEKPYLRGFYDSKIAAEHRDAPNRIRTVKFVEVLEEENKT